MAIPSGTAQQRCVGRKNSIGAVVSLSMRCYTPSNGDIPRHRIVCRSVEQNEDSGSVTWPKIVNQLETSPCDGYHIIRFQLATSNPVIIYQRPILTTQIFQVNIVMSFQKLARHDPDARMIVAHTTLVNLNIAVRASTDRNCRFIQKEKFCNYIID